MIQPGTWAFYCDMTRFCRSLLRVNWSPWPWSVRVCLSLLLLVLPDTHAEPLLRSAGKVASSPDPRPMGAAGKVAARRYAAERNADAYLATDAISLGGSGEFAWETAPFGALIQSTTPRRKWIWTPVWRLRMHSYMVRVRRSTPQ